MDLSASRWLPLATCVARLLHIAVHLRRRLDAGSHPARPPVARCAHVRHRPVVDRLPEEALVLTAHPPYLRSAQHVDSVPVTAPSAAPTLTQSVLSSTAHLMA